MLGHFETKTPSTNRTSLCWGTTSRPRHRQQIVHLNAGAPLRDQDTGNKSYIFVLGYHFKTKTPATNRISQCWGTSSRKRHPKQIIHLNAGASLRDQDTGNKSYILVLGHHFETKTPATDQDSGNISYIFALGYHFETKTLATNRTF